MFQKMADGKKTFDVRLADFMCKSGDTIIFEKWDPKAKKYTGGKLEKKVTYVLRTKEQKFWAEKDIKRYGFQIISFE